MKERFLIARANDLSGEVYLLLNHNHGKKQWPWIGKRDYFVLYETRVFAQSKLGW
jgi:hypothetical protein